MKIKKNAMLCCVISLIFTLAVGITGFLLLSSSEMQFTNDILAFVFRFFFITAPFMVLLTLITIARIKTEK